MRDPWEERERKKNTRTVGRNIYLFGEIEEDMIDDVIQAIHRLTNKNSKKPIKLFINSPGGDVSTGLALLDAVLNSKVPIYTIALGEVCSMASPIFIAGKKGHRYIAKHSQIMFHPITTGTHDYIKFAQARLKNSAELEKMYDKFILTNTKIPKEIYSKSKSEELYLNAEKCLKYKIADKYWMGQ
jgi:ATP-dependent Clp protease protease subunit